MNLRDVIPQSGNTFFIDKKGVSFSYNDLFSKYDEYLEQYKDLAQDKVVSLAVDHSFHSIVFLFAMLKLAREVLLTSQQSQQSQQSQLEVSDVFFSIEDENLKIIPGILASKPSSIRGNKYIGFLSSGTTNKPRMLKHSSTRLVESIPKNSRSYKTLMLFKLDHMGGFNTLVSCMKSSGTLIVPPNTFPATVLKSIEKFQVELLAATPTFLRMVLKTCDLAAFNLSSIETISFGAEPMSEYVLTELKSSLPSIRFYQTYGLTELTTFKTISHPEKNLFFKFKENNVEFRIVNNKLLLAATNMANDLKTINIDGINFYDTGDLVEVDGEYLKITGRESEIIFINGEKIRPQEIEDLISSRDDVKYVLIRGENHDLFGTVLVADLVLSIDKDPDSFESELKMFLKELLPLWKIPAVINFLNDVPDLPRHKLDRKTIE